MAARASHRPAGLVVRNLLESFVTDTTKMGALKNADINRLTLAKIREIAANNPSFAERVAYFKPIHQRINVRHQVVALLSQSGIVDEKVREEYVTYQDRFSTEPPYSFFETCLESVKLRTHDPVYFEQVLKTLSSSSEGVEMQGILNWRPKFGLNRDLGCVLIEFSKNILQHKQNIQAFFATYGLDAAAPDAVGKLCIGLAEHCEEILFKKIYKQEVFLNMSLPIQHKLLASVLNFSDQEIFHNVFANLDSAALSHETLMNCVSYAAANQKDDVFRLFMRLASKTSLNPATRTRFLVESAKFSDTTIFFDLVQSYGETMLNFDSLGKILCSAAEFCNSEILNFVSSHDKFFSLDEYYFGQALIAACKSENIEAVKLIFSLDRLTDLEDDIFTLAFFGGCITQENLDIAKVFKEKHYFDLMPQDHLLEFLEVFGVKNNTEACNLILQGACVVTLQSHQRLSAVMQELACHDASAVIAAIVESPLLDKQPQLIQTIFDRAYESKNLETLRVLLISSKNQSLDISKICKAIPALPDSGQLDFFENFGRIFVRNLSRLIPQESNSQRQELIKFFANRALHYDRRYLLQEVIASDDAKALPQSFYDTGFNYAFQKNLGCLELIMHSIFFSKVNSALLQRAMQHAVEQKRLDFLRLVLAGFSVHEEFNSWLFTKPTLERMLLQACENNHQEIVQLLLGPASKSFISRACIKQLHANKTTSSSIQKVLAKALV